MKIKSSLIAVLLLCFGFAGDSTAAGFKFEELNDKSLKLLEGEKPVFVYNNGVMLKQGVPADRTRSSYIHPLYGLEGEVLTDDFPKDHYHHRGLFWAWPHVKVGTNEYDFWMIKDAHTVFDKWGRRDAGEQSATLEVRNFWVAGKRRLMQEEVLITVHPADENSRAIDLQFTWTPLGEAVTLAGAEGKSYGGLTLRFAPRTNTVITTRLGVDEKDLPMTRLPWADLTAQYRGVSQPSGAAIFISKDHPDYPPEWLTRHYGVLCVGWPGIRPETLPANKSKLCKYRVLVHKGLWSKEQMQKSYDEYAK